jgi:hypothetical protein
MRDETTLKQVVGAKLRVMKHLSQQGDLSLIVLKGHLIVEELLFTVVTSAVRYPEALTSANLSFYQLASVAKAFFYEDSVAPIWDAIFELNKLRNALAHNLDLPDLENRLRRFGRVGSGGNAEAGDLVVAHPASVMAGSIEFMCGVLAGLIGLRVPAGAP